MNIKILLIAFIDLVSEKRELKRLEKEAKKANDALIKQQRKVNKMESEFKRLKVRGKK